MKVYAKIENQDSKVVSVGIGTNEAFYQSIGMELMEVEQGYDGNWYLSGYAPIKPQEMIDAELQARYTNFIQSMLDKEAQKLRL